MGTIRLSDDFVSPAISKSNPKITLNQKPNQQITAKIERYWEQIDYNNTFEVIPTYLRNKLHLHVHSTNSQYAHGQLSWDPNSFVNGSEINTDLNVNVTDATYINVTIPTGYTAYYFGPNSKLYDDTNYDNQIEPSTVTGKVALYNIDDNLSSGSSFYELWNSSSGSQTITHLDLSYLDVSKIRSVSGLIPRADGWDSFSPLTTVNIQNWYSNNITNFSSMLHNSGVTTLLGLENLNTSSATSMRNMFASSSGLTSLNVTNFDTSNVTDMAYMFNMCSGLTSLNVTNFDTTKATNISYMFCDCSHLTSLDLSGFQTYNVTNMMYCIRDCDNLITLDISNFNTTKITDSFNQWDIVGNCGNLQYLIIGSPTFKMPLLRSDAINVPSTCKILVPSDLISTYQSATNWTQHSSKFDAIENYTIIRSNGQVTVTPNNV